LNVKVSDMLKALEEVGGTAVRQRVRFERNEQVATIVSNWSRGSTAERAHALGLRPDASYNAIIEQYIEDCKTRPGYPTDALKGFA